MKYLLPICFFLTLLSCKKLEQQEFYLDNNCEDCVEILQKEPLEIKGLYYSEYEFNSGKLMVKYDPSEFHVSDLYAFLQESAFTKPKDSVDMMRFPKQPICCERD